MINFINGEALSETQREDIANAFCAEHNVLNRTNKELLQIIKTRPVFLYWEAAGQVFGELFFRSKYVLKIPDFFLKITTEQLAELNPTFLNDKR